MTAQALPAVSTLAPLEPSDSDPAPSDAEALFSTLYGELHRMARRELSRRGRNMTLGATTLLHEAYLGMSARSGMAFPDQARFMAYAARTMRGLIIDHVRHSRVVSITSSGNLELLEIPAQDINSEERIEFRQEVETVMAALNELPEACRETLILRRIEGLPQKEVAARLKISEKTVEKYMATGVRLLINLFGRGGKVRANTSTTQESGYSEDVAKKPRD